MENYGDLIKWMQKEDMCSDCKNEVPKIKDIESRLLLFLPKKVCYEVCQLTTVSRVLLHLNRGDNSKYSNFFIESTSNSIGTLKVSRQLTYCHIVVEETTKSFIPSNILEETSNQGRAGNTRTFWD